MKTIRCGDLMPGCDFEARASTDDELMQKVAAHAQDKHPDLALTPETIEAVKAKIRDS
ncbi:MAG: DUF1059 domain-containing protein [Azospirillaceae bacterium]